MHVNPGMAAVVSTGGPARLRNPGSSYFVLLVLGLVQLVGPYLSAYTQFWKTRFLRGPMRFHITSDNIRLDGAGFSGEVSWTVLNAVYETKNASLIYQTARIVRILPKRFFWDDSALITRFRQLLSSRLGARNSFRSTSFLGSWL
jgi:hypothetical protein